MSHVKKNRANIKSIKIYKLLFEQTLRRLSYLQVEFD